VSDYIRKEKAEKKERRPCRVAIVVMCVFVCAWGREREDGQYISRKQPKKKKEQLFMLLLRENRFAK